MQRLTAMMFGAMAIGFAGFVYDTASAQQRTASNEPASACPTHTVSIYFEKDSADFNAFSKDLVQRLALEAKSCGARQVVAEMKADGARAAAISSAFQPHGISIVVAPARGADAMADRMAVIRVASTTQRLG